MIFIFTGDQGGNYGYSDSFHPDGTFWYTGEGQVGDQQMIRGNAALRSHSEKRKTLHVFEYVSRGTVRYVGKATYAGHTPRAAPDRNGNPRRVIVFQLSMETVDSEDGEPWAYLDDTAEPKGLWNRRIEDLRRLALAADKADTGPAERKRNAYIRSKALQVYVIRRSGGFCEGCESKAPFLTRRGHPFLEAHHIRRRADGGPDHPRWVIALCPNCHRRVHHSADGESYNRNLADVAGQREADLF
jgi:5-methylcytosine-specific restriction enzyme A